MRNFLIVQALGEALIRERRVFEEDALISLVIRNYEIK